MDENDNQDLFAEAMGKVKPLQNSDKIHTEKNKAKAKQRLNTIQRTQQLPPSRAHVSRTAQARRDEPGSLIADGISRETIKRLAAGRPAIGVSFDLHGMTRDAAIDLLHDGLQQAIAEGIRALCIVHGRGLHSQGKPVLKQAVYHYLSEGPLAHMVLAVIPQPNSGGGACLILLRPQHKQ